MNNKQDKFDESTISTGNLEEAFSKLKKSKRPNPLAKKQAMFSEDIIKKNILDIEHDPLDEDAVIVEGIEQTIKPSEKDKTALSESDLESKIVDWSDKGTVEIQLPDQLPEEEKADDSQKISKPAQKSIVNVETRKNERETQKIQNGVLDVQKNCVQRKIENAKSDEEIIEGLKEADRLSRINGKGVFETKGDVHEVEESIDEEKVFDEDIIDESKITQEIPSIKEGKLDTDETNIEKLIEEDDQILQSEKVEIVESSDDSSYEIVADHEGEVINMDDDSEVFNLPPKVTNEIPSLMSVLMSDSEPDEPKKYDDSVKIIRNGKGPVENIVKKDFKEQINEPSPLDDTKEVRDSGEKSELEEGDKSRYEYQKINSLEDLDKILCIDFSEDLSDEQKNELRVSELKKLPREKRKEILGLSFMPNISEEIQDRLINAEIDKYNQGKTQEKPKESNKTISVNVDRAGEEWTESQEKKKIEKEKRQERIKLYQVALDSLKELEDNIDKSDDRSRDILKTSLLKVFAMVQDKIGGHISSFKKKDIEQPLAIDHKYGELTVDNAKQKILALTLNNEERQDEFIQELEKEINLRWRARQEALVSQNGWVKWTRFLPVIGPAVRWNALRRENKKMNLSLQANNALSDHFGLGDKLSNQSDEFIDDLNDELRRADHINENIDEILVSVARRLRSQWKSEINLIEDIDNEVQFKGVLEAIEKYTEGHIKEQLELENKLEKRKVLDDDQIEKIAKLTSVCAGLITEKNYFISKHSKSDGLVKQWAKKLDKMWFGEEGKITGIVTFFGAIGAGLAGKYILTYGGYAGRWGLGAVGLGGVGATYGMNKLLKQTKYFNTRLKLDELKRLDLDNRMVNHRAENVSYANLVERGNVVLETEEEMERERLVDYIKLNKNSNYSDTQAWHQTDANRKNASKQRIDAVINAKWKRDVKRWSVAALSGFGLSYLLHLGSEYLHGSSHEVPTGGVNEATPTPTWTATATPTTHPTEIPTVGPTHIPTVVPTEATHSVVPVTGVTPSPEPTEWAATATPTVHPTEIPTVGPTHVPTSMPTEVPIVDTSTSEKFTNWLGEAAQDKPDTYEETIENIKHLYFSQSEKLSPDRVVEYCQTMHIDCPDAVKHFIAENADQFGDNADGWENLRLVLNNTHAINDSTEYLDLMNVLHNREETISQMAGLFADNGALDFDRVADYCHFYNLTHVDPANIYIDEHVKGWLSEAVKSETGREIFANNFNGYRHLRLVLNNTNLISDNFNAEQVVKVAQMLERFGIKGTMLDGLDAEGKFMLMKQIANNWETLWYNPELMNAVKNNMNIGSQIISDYLYKYDHNWLKVKAAHNL